MADSNITVSALTATSGAGQVTLQCSISDPNARGLPYLALQAVEFWAAAGNDRSTAAKIGEGYINGQGNVQIVNSGLSQGQIKYYWAIARNASQQYGDWSPLSATGGVQGIEVNNDISLLTNGFFVQRPSGLIEQWGTSTSNALGFGDISFPREFPALCLNVSITPTVYFAGGPTSPWPVVANAYQQTRTGFLMYLFALPPSGGYGMLAGQTFAWRAVGK